MAAAGLTLGMEQYVPHKNVGRDGVPRSGAAPQRGTQGDSHGHVPGEEGIWVIVFGDLMVFTLFFGTFLYYRGQEIQSFKQAQSTLQLGYGLFNTLILLTSSLFVATAVKWAREGRHAQARSLVTAGLVCAAAFAGSKALEWSAKIQAGHGIGENDFFMFYFMLTGLHMLHVIIGSGVLLYMRARMAAAQRDRADPAHVSAIEAGGVFWHMVDLLWVMIFAILYLVR